MYLLVLSRLLGWPYVNTYIHTSHNKDLLRITKQSSISESFFLNDLTEADQMPDSVNGKLQLPRHAFDKRHS